MSEEESKIRKNWPWIFAILAFIVLIIGVSLLFYDLYLSDSFVDTNQGKTIWTLRGTMGDFYGGHLAAFSGIAAFLLMFTAILLQNKELELQRKELRKSLEIFEKQKEIQDKQVEITKNYYNREYILSVVKTLREIYLKVENLGTGYPQKQINERTAYFQLLDDLSIYMKNVKSPEQYYGLIKAGFIPKFIKEFNKNNNDENFPNADELIKEVGKPKEFTIPER